MKVAFCQIGHIRTWKIVSNNQLKNIIDPLNCDVFIDTSTQNSNPLGKNEKGQHKRLAWLEDQEKIEDLLNKTLGDRIKKKFIESEQPDPGYFRMIQWIRLSRCLKSIIDYENENNFTYDMIIKSRFDLHYHDKIPEENINNLEENVIYGCKHYDGGLKLHDQFFFGKRESMMKFINFPDVYKKDNNSERQVISFISSNKMEIKLIKSLGFEMKR